LPKNDFVRPRTRSTGTTAALGTDSDERLVLITASLWHAPQAYVESSAKDV
jgi:hypothetical protein